jgi:DtxR family Mn-dependent transcriptional regulator
MSDSIFLIVIFCIILIILVLIFWPHRGLAFRLKLTKKDKMRILSEDCLKFLHNCEYRENPCNREGIAAAFSLSLEDADLLLLHLKLAGLIEISNDHIQLTKSGRTSALQIVRIHRLLEKYMADETSLTEAEWHPVAEDREHNVTIQEANELAAQLGNPVYDPHGDPIPTADGEIPSSKGLSLNGIESGTTVKVLHIEDEPPEVYSQIISENIHPGVKMRILEKTGGEIYCEVNGSKKKFTVATAENITVFPLKNGDRISIPFKSLSSLKPGESGQVISISKACRVQQRRRLMDLGVVPGSVISAEMKSVGGDPTAYHIRGALIALRKQQADYINIEKYSED